MPEVPPNQPVQPAQPGKQLSKRSRITRVTILVAVLVGVLVTAYFAARDQPSNAQVGQCVERTGENSLSIVDCGKAEAQYKVVGRKENLTQYGNFSVCDEFDGASDRYWQGKQGEEGFFLCLAPVTRP